MEKTKNLSEFQIGRQPVWVAFLDGVPINGYDKAASDTKRGISSSLSYKFRGYARQYGFKTGGEMRAALEEAGRLQIIQIQ